MSDPHADPPDPGMLDEIARRVLWLAVRMVWEIASAIRGVPIIGIGGITSADDVLEFMVAGASAVQVGTGNFWNAQASTNILDQLPAKLAEAKVGAIRELIATCGSKAAH